MKKTMIALAMMLGIAGGAAAQEVAISYGGYTQMDAVNNHKGFDKTNNAWGAVNVSLYLPVAKGVKVGPSYTYSSQFTPAAAYEIPGLEGTYDLKSKVGYHAIMLNVKVDYWHNSIVNLYGHAGAGAVIAHMMPKYQESYNKGYFAGQISPIGAEVSFTPHAYMFGELGFGAQGLVQVGFKYAF